MTEISYYYIYKDSAGQWRWRFTAKNGKIIAMSSESYHNLADCEHAVGLIKTQSASSPVIGDDDYGKLRK